MANAHTKTSGTFIEAVKESLAVAVRYNSGDRVNDVHLRREQKENAKGGMLCQRM
jgi:hypothetical protein